MLERPKKSVLRAYLYLALLGPLGGHRFYMKRPGTGLFMAMLFVVGLAAWVAGTVREQNDLIYLGYFCGAFVLAGMVVDLVMIPGMIEELNDPGEDRRMSVIAGNLDPSFQATLRHAGRDEQDRPRKSALPADYERPWHKKGDRTDVYKPGED